MENPIDRFDVLEAYYLFATLHHGGQGSPEYKIFGRLHKLGFKPRPSLRRPEDLTPEGRAVYDELVARQARSEPHRAARREAAIEQYAHLLYRTQQRQGLATFTHAQAVRNAQLIGLPRAQAERVAIRYAQLTKTMQENPLSRNELIAAGAAGVAVIATAIYLATRKKDVPPSDATQAAKARDAVFFVSPETVTAAIERNLPK